MSEDVRHVLDRAEWARPGHETGDLWRGRFDGDAFGAHKRLEIGHEPGQDPAAHGRAGR